VSTPYPLAGQPQSAENGESRIRQQNTLVLFCLNGDDLTRNACGASYGNGLNIRYGHGAFVVVWGRESRPHGEGRQFTFQSIL